MKLNRENLLALLREIEACDPAIRWFKRTPGTPYELWRKCPRGDWLVWLAFEVGAHSDPRFEEAEGLSNELIGDMYHETDNPRLSKKKKESLRKCAVFVRQCIKWRTVKQALLCYLGEEMEKA